MAGGGGFFPDLVDVLWEFVSGGFDDAVFEVFEKSQGREQVAQAKQEAIAFAEGSAANAGMATIIEDYLVPAIEKLPNRPENCLAQLPSLYSAMGEYIEFTSEIVSECDSIISYACEQAIDDWNQYQEEREFIEAELF